MPGKVSLRDFGFDTELLLLKAAWKAPPMMVGDEYDSLGHQSPERGTEQGFGLTDRDEVDHASRQAGKA